jgi:type II secretory pathway pseudopilin PulG
MNYIKTNLRARQSGTTLLELSVVIAVILLLVSVTFVGINAWRNSANSAACILNLSSIQKAVRSYQNLNNLNVTDPLASTLIIGTGKLLEVAPVCPSAPTASYTFLGTVPATGTPYATCPYSSPPAPSAAQSAAW